MEDGMPTPICMGCKKRPEEIPEYTDREIIAGMTPDDYVQREEGTYNPENGHFLCTECYIKAGQPSRPYPRRWICP
jgi:hypothetical protein